MLGDRAPIREIIEVKKQHNSLLMVDEAHSLGVLGARGRGLVEAAGVIDETDFIVGTFSKSLGSIGGYCVSNHAAVNLLRYASRPFIFTASPSPAVIASTRTALKILQNATDRRERLWAHGEKLYAHLQSAGYQVGPEPGPVVAVLLDSREAGADDLAGAV